MSAPPPPEEENPNEALGRLGAMEERCRGLIRQTSNWPREGVSFLDASPLYCDAAALRACVDALAERYRTADVTHFAGVDARGFGLACTVAYALGAGFVMVRKQGKLPPRFDKSNAKLLRSEYQLEYGADALEVSSDIFDESGAVNKVVIIDDLAATGGTAIAAANLLRDVGAVVHEVAVLVELAGSLQPRQRIKNEAFVRLHSLLVFEV